MGGEGENQNNATVPASSRRRRHGLEIGNDDISPLDKPPPVASPMPQWEPRSLATRTPQRLCTFVHPPTLRREFQSDGANTRANFAPCDPLLAFKEYIVTATDDARVCVYDVNARLFSEEQNSEEYPSTERQKRERSRKSMDAIAPIAVMNLSYSEKLPSDTPPIVALSATPLVGMSMISYSANGETVLPPGFLGHVAALTAEGCVHILEFKKTSQQLTASCVYTWDTGDGSATALTIHSFKKLKYLRICVGYQNGCVSDWEVSVPVTTAQQSETPSSAIDSEGARDNEIGTVPLVSNSWRVSWSEAESRLMWRGCFGNPISSVSSLGLEISEGDKSCGSEHNGISDGGGEAIDRGSFLAICIVQPSNDDNEVQTRSTSRLEVININNIENDWIETLAQANYEFIALSLDDYCTWPEAGMEIMNTSSLSATNDKNLPRRIHGIDSRGSNRVCAFHGSYPSFVATFNEGTVALMHSFMNASNDDNDVNMLSWGVTHAANQLLMSYPCIGVGQLDLTGSDVRSEEESSSKILACCLRGGTVYLIPFNKMGTEPSNQQTNITVFSCPDDVDSEACGALRYVQGFTAGNIRSQAGTSVFAYCWAGGVLDVYVDGLQRNGSETETVLKDLITNGAVQLLLDLLLSLEQDDALLRKDLWKNAWDELITDTVEDSDSIAEELLRQPPVKFDGLCCLLLELSRNSSLLDRAF